MTELLHMAKNCTHCLLIKSSTQFSAVKGFHTYDISILISAQANCIDSAYEILVVCWYDT